MTAALEAEITVRRGPFTLDVALSVAAGQLVALLGPNGAGKSTLLNALSGLVTPDRARVQLFGRMLDAAPSRDSVLGGRTVRVAPEHRRIGLLSQDPLLFPHLTALENVAFGQRVQGIDTAAARRDALDWLDAVGLADFSGRKPAALSGGQQQRVAIARALAARPDLLLLDEPLAALDVQTAAQTRRMLVERLRSSGTTTILVTHDVLDAITVAGRCAILSEGRIVDDGPNETVLGHPRTAFIADLAGMNLLTGRFAAGGVAVADGWRVHGRVEGLGPADGATVSATFSPSAVRMRRAEMGGYARPGGADARQAETGADATHAAAEACVATIAALEPAGGGIRLRLERPHLTLITPHSRVVELDLRIGDRVAFDIDASDVTIRSAG